eukprot:Partr_v1_DN28379_c1_g1_i1_m79319 putative UBA domain containing 2
MCFITAGLSHLLMQPSWRFFLSGSAISSGPYALIFSSLYQYYAIVPPMNGNGGGMLSGKTPMYALALQLLLVAGWSGSVPAALSGWIAGVIWRENIGGLGKWRFPSRLVDLSRRWLLPLVRVSAPSTTASSPDSPTATTTTSGSGNNNRVEASEENIEALVAMGFERERARQVLTRCNNDLQRAVNALL